MSGTIPEGTGAPASAQAPAAVGTPTPARTAARRRARAVCWWAGLGLLLLALAVAGVVLFEPGFVQRNSLGVVTLVLAGWIPSWGAIQAVSIVSGIALLVVARVLAPPRPGRARAALRIAAVSVAGVLLLPAVFVVAVFDGNSYSVLPGESDGGCRVVVREFSFLYAGGGAVGVLQPGAVVVDWAALPEGISTNYFADDGYRPFTFGTYTLTWEGPLATIDLREGGAGPVGWEYSEAPVLRCDR
ncbi:MAG: hypothetical protein Q7T71_11510 [Herbiconiux sp.]|nr:hypothetical protein [Herbiconiux sp.]